MKLLIKVNTFFDRIIALLAILAAFLVVFILLTINTEVVMRYFLVRPIKGVIELTEYALVYITFLGTAWVLKEEGHIKMDLLLNRLNPRNRALLNIVNSILCAMVCLILTWYGAMGVWGYFQMGYTLPSQLAPPAAPLLTIIPVGTFLLFIQFLRRTYGYLRSARA